MPQDISPVEPSNVWPSARELFDLNEQRLIHGVPHILCTFDKLIWLLIIVSSTLMYFTDAFVRWEDSAHCNFFFYFLEEFSIPTSLIAHMKTKSFLSMKNNLFFYEKKCITPNNITIRCIENQNNFSFYCEILSWSSLNTKRTHRKHRGHLNHQSFVKF